MGYSETPTKGKVMNNEPLNTQEIIGMTASVVLIGLSVRNIIKVRRETRKTEENIEKFNRINDALDEKFGSRLNQF